MDSSSVCEKTRIDLVVKNSRNLFYKTVLKTLLLKWKYLALKQVEKTSKRVEKTDFETLSKILYKTAQNSPLT